MDESPDRNVETSVLLHELYNKLAARLKVRENFLFSVILFFPLIVLVSRMIPS